LLTAHQYEYLKTLNGLTSSGGSSDSAGHRFGVRFWQTNTTQLWLKRSGAGSADRFARAVLRGPGRFDRPRAWDDARSA
jgi:hypothetical protein